MRPLPWIAVERYRLLDVLGWKSRHGDDFGVFRIPHPPTGAELAVVASAGETRMAWEHVSVSVKNRCPNWPEMAFVKDLFWLPTETVMQLHVPESDHRNLHPYCLHLWRPIGQEIPRPPNEAVAVPGNLATNERYRNEVGEREYRYDPRRS